MVKLFSGRLGPRKLAIYLAVFAAFVNALRIASITCAPAVIADFFIDLAVIGALLLTLAECVVTWMAAIIGVFVFTMTVIVMQSDYVFGDNYLFCRISFGQQHSGYDN